MIEYDGTPFEYNPNITNVNIDNQVAAILSKFSDDSIIDVVKDSLNMKFRVYSLPAPNIVSAFENRFKILTDGFSSNTDEILQTRKRVYLDIISIICQYYDLTFMDNESMDYYSAAYWLYEVFISRFTDNIKNFYVRFLINEKDYLYTSLDLEHKNSEIPYEYSKRLFKDPVLASIHCNIEYVISQISTIDVSLNTIIAYSYPENSNVPAYISGIIRDNGNFFKNYYEKFILESRESSDALIQIKLYLQQVGGQLEPLPM